MGGADGGHKEVDRSFSLVQAVGKLGGIDKESWTEDGMV